MEGLTILVSRLYKSVASTKYFSLVPLVGLFMPFVGVICRPVESPFKGPVINYGVGGVAKCCKSLGQNFLHPPPPPIKTG